MDPTVSADPHRDSVETSISSSISDAISFSTFRISVKSLLKQWLMTGPRCHKLTGRLDALCDQLQSLRQATVHTCDVFRLRKDFAEAW